MSVWEQQDELWLFSDSFEIHADAHWNSSEWNASFLLINYCREEDMWEA